MSVNTATLTTKVVKVFEARKERESILPSLPAAEDEGLGGGLGMEMEKK